MQYNTLKIPEFDFVIVPEEGLGTGRSGVTPFLFELPEIFNTNHKTSFIRKSKENVGRLLCIEEYYLPGVFLGVNLLPPGRVSPVAFIGPAPGTPSLLPGIVFLCITPVIKKNETAVGLHVYRKGAPMPPPPLHVMGKT